MATHSLAIAKASFAAGMMRPDPTSLVPRAEISRLHLLLENSLHKCTPSNIQLCKDWLIKHTLPSATRTAAFGKYLVALSLSLGNHGDKKVSKVDTSSDSPVCQRQVNILYLLNDLLHHAKYHLAQDSVYSTLVSNIQPHLTALAGISSAYDPTKSRKHLRKIEGLLEIWSEKRYFDPLYLQKLRVIVEKAQETADSEKFDQPQRNPGDLLRDQKANAPYIMPNTHGEFSTPFYDLPAGNMLPHIIPNSVISINPQHMNPLQLTAGPAEESLINVLKKFMEDVDRNNKTMNEEGIVVDIDELGNVVFRDGTTGESVDGDSYYGWSREMCEKMKRRRDGIKYGMDRTKRDGSNYRSLSPRKRRRYSYSENNGDWKRGRSISTTASPSGSAARRRSSRHSASRGRNSRSRSTDNPLPTGTEYRNSRARSRSISRSTSRSKSYSSPRNVEEPQQRQTIPTLPQLPLPPPTTISAVIPPPTSFSQALSQGFPSGHGILSIPPPRPPNYQGPWPPPPPPLPYHSTNMVSDGRSYASFPSFGSQPPPPFDHQSKQPIYATWGKNQNQHQHQSQFDRSGNLPYPNHASGQTAFEK